MSPATQSPRTDTAYKAWDERWQSEDGRADWLVPAPDVAALAGELYARGDRTVLDLGCGVGRHALHFAELGFQTHAIDGSEAGLAELARAAGERGVSVSARRGLMTELAYDDNRFDYVLAFNVIYHGDGEVVHNAIAEIARVLKPGGTFQGTMLSKRNRNHGLGREISQDTYVNDKVDDKAHPHFYCNGDELTLLFSQFRIRSLEEHEHRRPGSWHWHLVAELGQ